MSSSHQEDTSRIEADKLAVQELKQATEKYIEELDAKYLAEFKVYSKSAEGLEKKVFPKREDRSNRAKNKIFNKELKKCAKKLKGIERELDEAKKVLEILDPKPSFPVKAKKRFLPH